MIRLIVSDLDDTLLNERAEIAPRTERAFDRARAAGCEVALASGRMVSAMKPYAKQLRITNPMIAYNGAALADPKTFAFLEETPIDHETAMEVLTLCEARNLHAQVYVNDVYYADPYDELAVSYGKAVGLTGKGAGMKLTEFLTGTTTKLLVIDDASVIAKLVPEFTERFGDRLTCASSRATYLEITRKEANKGDMIEKLARRMGIPLSDIAAFGDGQNDIPMLSRVGYGCCVMNAKSEVRAQAKYVCPANTEAGVAQRIEELIAQGAVGGGK